MTNRFEITRNIHGQWQIGITEEAIQTTGTHVLARSRRKVKSCFGTMPRTRWESITPARAKRILDKAREGKVSRIAVQNIESATRPGAVARAGSFTIEVI